MIPPDRRSLELGITLQCIAIGALFLLLYPLAMAERAVQFVEGIWEAVT